MKRRKHPHLLPSHRFYSDTLIVKQHSHTHQINSSVRIQNSSSSSLFFAVVYASPKIPKAMQSPKPRRKAGPTTTNGPDSAEKLDELLISSAICNNEDLGPFVRKTFGTGKPETLLHHLKFFARSKESEIEEVCKAHYQDFIHAVDDLKSLLSDVESLKSALSDSNSSSNPSRLRF
ncbi:hypothetical protein Bca52824_045968 [Brassica carinata]|uniref:Exocyst complex component EXOC6/Sec15 N-terminal domain-containing protein n=1 Tax=Brassica carinata TaxID=52824 RepID=A0A8X7UPS5_BRACI|nr:hypothetical protein Bca52824_045968 [Brassica carinata]